MDPIDARVKGSQADERRLLQELQGGSEASFLALYELYWKRLFVVANNRLKNTEEAEDVVSGIFADLWVSRRTLSIHTSLDAYLAVALKHRILNIIRRRKLQEHYAAVVRTHHFEAAPLLDQKIDFEELYSRWVEVVNQLPPKCRIVYTLTVEEELTAREVASRLKVSERTVENHKYRALKILKTKLTVLIVIAIAHS